MTPWPVFNPPIPAPIEPIPYTGKHGSRMKEWAEIRTKTSTSSAKFFANNLNDAHSAFMADELTSEEYISEVFGFLESSGSQDDVFAFLFSIQEQLDAKTFCPEDAKPKFSTRINNAWKAYQQSQGISTSPDEQQEQEEGIADDPALSPSVEDKEDYRQLKKKQNKATVIAAHSGMKTGTVSERDFLTTTRKFILLKVQGGLKDFTKHGITEEDVTQNALMKMCDALPRFEGTSEDYFYWLQRVIYTAVLDARKVSTKEDSRHAPLFVVNEDGEEDENPGIGGKIAIKRNGKTEYQDPRPQYSKPLPNFIEGTNLRICQLIQEGHDYDTIGQKLGLSTSAVTMRVSKMRKRIKEAK
jgi:DNA-directed RNA polymerase specialized sigma24 family protein